MRVESDGGHVNRQPTTACLLFRIAAVAPYPDGRGRSASRHRCAGSPAGHLGGPGRRRVPDDRAVRLPRGSDLRSRRQAVPGVRPADEGQRRRPAAARRDRLSAGAVAGPCRTGAGPSDRHHRDPGGNAVEQRNDAGNGVDRDGDRAHRVGQRGDGTEPFDSGRRRRTDLHAATWARSVSRCNTTWPRRCTGSRHDRIDGRIRVPADLDAVTAVGDEDHSDDRLRRPSSGSGRPRGTGIAAGMHPAIQLCLRHNGKVVLNRAIGHGWGNGPDDPPDAEKVPVTTETPFCVYSAAKAITTTVVHMLVERGVFSLDDRVCEYLPSYTSHGKDRTTIRHVMTHSAGVPFATGPRPDLKRMDDSEYAREMLGNLKPIYRPGLVHIYHGADVGPAGARDRLGRHRQEHPRDPGHRDPRSARLPVDELRRCGSTTSRWWRRATRPASRCPRRSRRRSSTAVGGTMHQIIPFSNTPQFLTGVVPSSNTVSTADELSRFAEILRRGGELDGVRVMQPETLRAATRECRRLRPDLATGLAPLRWGTGYMLGSNAVRAVRAQCACGVRPHRPDQHRGLGRPGTRARRRASSAAASRAVTVRPTAIPPCWTASPPRYPAFRRDALMFGNRLIREPGGSRWTAHA